MTDHQDQIHLPDKDREMLESISRELPDPVEQELLPPAELFERYQRLRQAATETLSHSFRVVEHFQAWRIDASHELAKVDDLVKEMEKFNDHLHDEMVAALGIKNDLILDTAEAAAKYIANLPPQPRISAESILKEYEENLTWVDDQLKQEELINEPT